MGLNVNPSVQIPLVAPAGVVSGLLVAALITAALLAAATAATRRR